MRAGRGSRDLDGYVDRFVASYAEVLVERARQLSRGEIPDRRHPFADELVLAAWVTSPEGSARLRQVADEAVELKAAQRLVVTGLSSPLMANAGRRHGRPDNWGRGSEERLLRAGGFRLRRPLRARFLRLAARRGDRPAAGPGAGWSGRGRVGRVEVCAP
jgi:hypothetical protein